jgi:transcriptional regulator with XRE-family HTH domain
MKNRIGVAVKEKRKAFGYSQEELAEKIGVTPSFVGQIERGTSLPGVMILEQLTLLLAIDANLYFYDTNDRAQESREFYLMLEQLTPEMRKLALEIIKQIYKFGR